MDVHTVHKGFTDEWPCTLSNHIFRVSVIISWMPLKKINSRMPDFAPAIYIVTKVTHKCREVKSTLFTSKWKESIK